MITDNDARLISMLGTALQLEGGLPVSVVPSEIGPILRGIARRMDTLLDRPKLVHNHGPEDGPGITCPESLIGDCLRQPPGLAGRLREEAKVWDTQAQTEWAFAVQLHDPDSRAIRERRATGCEARRNLLVEAAMALESR